MADEWTVDRVILAPKRAADLLNDHARRVAELLEANNRYQQEARDARAAQRHAEMQARGMADVALKNGEALLAAEAQVRDLEGLLEKTGRALNAEEFHKQDIADHLLVTGLRLEAAQDKSDGLQADLDSALDVLERRIIGEADLPSAFQWLRLNYPDRAEALVMRRLSPFVGKLYTRDAAKEIAAALRAMCGDFAPAVGQSLHMTWPTEEPVPVTPSSGNVFADLDMQHRYVASATRPGRCATCGAISASPIHSDAAPVRHTIFGGRSDA